MVVGENVINFLCFRIEKSIFSRFRGKDFVLSPFIYLEISISCFTVWMFFVLKYEYVG